MRTESGKTYTTCSGARRFLTPLPGITLDPMSLSGNIRPVRELADDVEAILPLAPSPAMREPCDP